MSLCGYTCYTSYLKKKASALTQGQKKKLLWIFLEKTKQNKTKTKHKSNVLSCSPFIREHNTNQLTKQNYKDKEEKGKGKGKGKERMGKVEVGCEMDLFERW